MTKFILKVLRNSFILTGLLFVSLWLALPALNWMSLKPVIAFLLTYVLTEMGHHYRVRGSPKMKTLCF